MPDRRDGDGESKSEAKGGEFSFVLLDKVQVMKVTASQVFEFFDPTAVENRL